MKRPYVFKEGVVGESTVPYLSPYMKENTYLHKNLRVCNITSIKKKPSNGNTTRNKIQKTLKYNVKLFLLKNAK